MQHYDVIVLGEGLAARIAALLLARGGCRVLAFRNPTAPSAVTPAWFFPSLFLERLLENLGGRSCYTPVAPFQVLTSKTRLEFLGRESIEGELQREFPCENGGISAVLGLLQKLGSRLEEILWQSGGLPLTGLRSRLRFACRRLRRGIGSGLSRPLSSLWKGIGDSEGREVLEALFTGLTLTPPERLSVAEGALIWHCARKTDGLSLSGFEDLLQRRYNQFHGEEEALAGLESLDCEDGGIRGNLKGGGRFSAKTIVLGECPAGSLFRANALGEWKSPSPLETFIVTFHEGRPSPLLASRFILGGPHAIRLSFMEEPSRKSCLVESPSAEAPEGIQPQDIHTRLAAIFPFARFQVARRPSPLPEPDRSGPKDRRIRSGFPGAAASLKLGKNILNCNGAAVFPALGGTGEALVGVSVANHLLGKFRKKD